MVTGNRIVPCRLGFYCNGRHRTRLSPREKVSTRFAPGRCSYTKTDPPPNRRSTRPGCDICPAIRTEAVLLQKYSPPPDRRSTRRRCDTCSPPFAPGRCSYTKTAPPPNRRSTRPGCDTCPPRSHRGGAPTQKQPLPRIVGAPAPGANMCRGGDAGGIATGRRFGDAVQHRDQPRNQGPEPCASLNRESPSSAPDWRG